MNRKEKAIGLIDIQIYNLSTLSSDNIGAWRSKTKELFKKYLGEDSSFVQEFEKSKIFWPNSYYINEMSDEASSYCYSAIQYIEEHGTYKSKINLFGKMTRFEAVSICILIIGPIIVASFWAGVEFKSFRADQETESLKIKIAYLKDSLYSCQKERFSIAKRGSNKPNDQK